MRLGRLLIVMAAAAAVTAVVLWIRFSAEVQRELERVAAQDEAALDDLHLDLAGLDATPWVRQHRPQLSGEGYTLVLYRRRVPVIIDMNGRIVHLWPHVRVIGRARLNPNGTLAVIGTDNLVKEYAWDGDLRWVFRLEGEGDFPHHDLIRLRNGNYLILARDVATSTGYLQEVDRRGRVVWQWRSHDHIEAFPTWDRDLEDPTHFNSVHELPPNRHFDSGDERFRPGNILVSARHLNSIFIIDKSSGAVVWQYTGNLIYQHEATMVPKGEPDEGRILVFNNGRRDEAGVRLSLIQSIEPVSGVIAWEYGSRYFLSTVAGTVQALPGGNTLIASSHGGRIFELTPDGAIVWELVPPYMPMRPERIASDHCPQLAALDPPEKVEVNPGSDAGPYVDMDLYRFALSGEFTDRVLAGHTRRIVHGLNECRDLLIPPAAQMWVEFGIDGERLQDRSIEARFRLTIQGRDEEPETLLDTALNEQSESPWRGLMFRLAKYAYRDVTLCIATEVSGEMENPEEIVAWKDPAIHSPELRPHYLREQERISERERRLREQQLKALGYVN